MPAEPDVEANKEKISHAAGPTILTVMLSIHFAVFALLATCVLLGYAVEYHLHFVLLIGITQLLFAAPGYQGAYSEETTFIYTFAVLSILLGATELGWSVFALASGGSTAAGVCLLLLALFQFLSSFIAMRLPFKAAGGRIAGYWPYAAKEAPRNGSNSGKTQQRKKGGQPGAQTSNKPTSLKEVDSNESQAPSPYAKKDSVLESPSTKDESLLSQSHSSVYL
ncbi:hypothetical protein AAVH_07817 [Aphelenchoides avenae]|nr:hypothetical protein AAVH_32634 [Aphelenchus avenae]KAH7724676.1 hypothetical protein AAVH_07817 [Aphelenchus avenae]